MPLVAGTLTTTLWRWSSRLPLGTTIAIYLSEFAPSHVRETVKPILELLGAVPTVVYGYFALTMVTPVLQMLMPELPGFNMLRRRSRDRPDDRAVHQLGERGRHAIGAALHA
jgi:phosphate transport system permease protein